MTDTTPTSAELAAITAIKAALDPLSAERRERVLAATLILLGVLAVPSMEDLT